HTHAEVEAGLPIGVDLLQLARTERGAFDRRARGAVRGERSVSINFFRQSCHESHAPFTGNARLPSGCLFVPFVSSFIDAVRHDRFSAGGLATSQPTFVSRA